MKIHHLNCGLLHAPPFPPAACHGLLVEAASGLTLVDTGIGLADAADPLGRIGREAIDAAGFQFEPSRTALRQIEQLGLRPADVLNVVLTHGDPDHVGGLADFPRAKVHIAREEYDNIASGNPRYSAAQFSHEPNWQIHEPPGEATDLAERWFGLSARRVDVGPDVEMLLVPFFGHTAGQCGVAIREGQRWLLHVGDAYYLRVELETDEHPVSQLAAARADDDRQRRESLTALRRLAADHGDEVAMVGYHDFSEFPRDSIGVPVELLRRQVHGA